MRTSHAVMAFTRRAVRISMRRARGASTLASCRRFLPTSSLSGNACAEPARRVSHDPCGKPGARGAVCRAMAFICGYSAEFALEASGKPTHYASGNFSSPPVMSQFFRIHPDNPQPRLINQAVQIINDGGIVALPTDSSYALACHLDDKDAVERIRRI